MTSLLNSRLQEIAQCLQNEDLNRASRRMLDFTKDFCPENRILQKAIQLRAQYNKDKELGSRDNNDKALSIALMSFYADEICNLEAPISNNENSKQLLAEARGITKKYRSRLHKFCLEPIDIEFRTGEITGLVGENGNGKTTLLRIISGALQANGGTFTFYKNEQAIHDWSNIRPLIAYIPQRIKRWYGTAEENLSFEAAIKGVPAEQNRSQVEYIIHRLGLTNFRELTWSQLSGGYKLRFEIAKALVWDPKLLILDEPLANLDIQAQELLLQDLRNMADSLNNPVSIILSSQQLHEVEAIADRVIFLKNGRAIHNGPLSNIASLSDECTIEVSGAFGYHDLAAALQGWDELKIEESASSFTVTFSAMYTLNDFLSKLISAKINIEYYRDISKSTKKLFSDKY